MLHHAAILLLALALPAQAAPSAEEIAATMRQARLSDGFEARMQVAVVMSDGRRLPPFKLSVVGQANAERQRLRVRGISPDAVRNRHLAAERAADGRIRAIAYGGASGLEKIEPFTGVFDSGMVLWDLLGAWWSWPGQEIAGSDRLGGRECALVRSRTDDAGSAVREVVSCVDRRAGLSLRTRLYDRRQRLLRTITVKQTMRKESGALGAKRLTIEEADRRVTEIEVYAGDEHYLVGDEVFSPLDESR